MDVYFDTQAIGYFDEHPDWTAKLLSAARRRVHHLAEAGELTVFVSYPLLEEVLGLLNFNAEKYHREMGFLLDISQFNLLRSTDELGRIEAMNGGRLEGNDRLELWVRALSVRRALRKGREDIPRLTQAAFAQFEADEERRRDEVRARLAADSGARAIDGTRRWWRDAERQIDDWVSDHMVSNRERLGLPEDRTRWPVPSALQTIWRYYGYRMARVHLNVGEARRVRGSDSYDAHHYAAATTMDVLVSDDRDLRATCAEIPRQRFRLLTFEEFLGSHLGITRAA
jgi:hypothetical protein